MGSTLYRTYAKFVSITLALVCLSGEAKALAVECAGCVAATNSVQSAVESGNATLSSILTELGAIKNHLNQIRLAVGPATTTTALGTLSQTSDFLNFSGMTPSAEPFSLDKGGSLDFSNLTGLKEKLNDALKIYSTAKETKEALESGVLQKSPLEAAKVIYRRKRLIADSVQRTLSSNLYSLSQTEPAKTRELSLSQGRRGALNIQMKINALSKTQEEVLSRLNHLIALIAAQNTMNAAQTLEQLPKETPGGTPPPASANGAGDASNLFNGGTK